MVGAEAASKQPEPVLKQKLLACALCLGGRVRFRVGRKSLLGECLLYPIFGVRDWWGGGLERGLERHNCVLYKLCIVQIGTATSCVKHNLGQFCSLVEANTLKTKREQ